MQAAHESEAALLVFSGGFTRTEAGARSEAGSYWQVADALSWFGLEGVAERALVEDRARDSFENLLFSICRFRQFAGVYPQKVTIVSYDFKRERFVSVHAAALGFETEQVNFVGTPALDASGATKVRDTTQIQCYASHANACRLYAPARSFLDHLTVCRARVPRCELSEPTCTAAREIWRQSGRIETRSGTERLIRPHAQLCDRFCQGSA